jgi:hypothetical protein
MIDLPDIAEDRGWGPLVKEGTVMYNERLRAGVDDDEWMTVPC